MRMRRVPSAGGGKGGEEPCPNQFEKEAPPSGCLLQPEPGRWMGSQSVPGRGFLEAKLTHPERTRVEPMGEFREPQAWGH